MDEQALAELADLYEAYLHGNRSSPQTKQSKGLFDLLANKLYLAETEAFRSQVPSIERYRASVLIPEIESYLRKKQTPFPTITPERNNPAP